jgi:hypothetical protein
MVAVTTSALSAIPPLREEALLEHAWHAMLDRQRYSKMQLSLFQNIALFRRTLFQHTPLPTRQTGRARQKRAIVVWALPEFQLIPE